MARCVSESGSRTKPHPFPHDAVCGCTQHRNGRSQLSTNQWENDAEGQEQQETPKGLRAQLEAALAKVKTLEDQRDKALAQAREATVSGVLKAKGINAKVA